MPQNIVHIENLVKRYGDLVALNHLNLDIREGEVFGLLGPNGSGKTTAINCMLSLLKYDKGTIEIFGEPMSPDNYQVKKTDWDRAPECSCLRGTDGAGKYRLFLRPVHK